MKYNAVVLAGGKNKDLITDDLTVNYEALIQVIKRPMIAYILQALLAAKGINKVVVVGPKEEEKMLLANGADLVVGSKESIVDNIELGLDMIKRKFEESQYTLVISSDIPLITANAIDAFINDCEKFKGRFGVYYPIIRKEKNLAAYPHSARTYVKLKEGTYTGGNLGLIRSEIINKSADLMERIMANRKHPLKMSRVLGFKFVIKLLCGRLSLVELEKRVSNLINDRCKAVITDYPELGFDVDKQEDLEIIQNLCRTLPNT